MLRTLIVLSGKERERGGEMMRRKENHNNHEMNHQSKVGGGGQVIDLFDEASWAGEPVNVIDDVPDLADVEFDKMTSSGNTCVLFWSVNEIKTA